MKRRVEERKKGRREKRRNEKIVLIRSIVQKI